MKRNLTRSCGCLRKEQVRLNFPHDALVDGTFLSRLNTKLPRHNTSGVRGVCFVKQHKKWVAYIHFKGEKINLGCFSHKQDAINARKEAEEKYFKPILEKYKKEPTSSANEVSH